MKITKSLAICVGLWLAEGDNKTTREITFTNSQVELIIFFYKHTKELTKMYNSRIYAYSKKKGIPSNPIKEIINYKTYTDERARRPYFILRTASVELVRNWKILVKEVIKGFSKEIIQGIFAGEGSVKVGSHNSRVLRIAQKGRSNLFEKLFDKLELAYRYIDHNRTYEFTSKKNWDIFAKYELADLHPLKKELFWKAYNSYQQTHYPKNYLKNRLFMYMKKPMTKKRLAQMFNRSPARIYDVLKELKDEEKVTWYRQSKSIYWVRNRNE